MLKKNLKFGKVKFKGVVAWILIVSMIFNANVPHFGTAFADGINNLMQNESVSTTLEEGGRL